MSDFETLSELDLLAVGFIDGQIDIDTLKQLDPINKILVLGLSGLYGCTKMGFISGKKCAQNKLDLLSMYRMLRTNTYFMEIEHREWCRRTKETSGLLCRLAKAIENKAPDTLSLALKIIDLLTKDDVYNQMLILSGADEEFKDKCVQSLTKNETLFFDRFGNIPYIDLLFKFYSSTIETRAAEVFKELGTDNLRTVARHVPVKSDDIKGIAQSYDNMLNKRRI